jgi:type I restriction-modification system DNA methylase subunit
MVRNLAKCVYDPTCGSGGSVVGIMLCTSGRNEEYRTLKLYGQELLTDYTQQLLE